MIGVLVGVLAGVKDEPWTPGEEGELWPPVRGSNPGDGDGSRDEDKDGARDEDGNFHPNLFNIRRLRPRMGWGCCSIGDCSSSGSESDCPQVAPEPEAE